MDDGTRDAADEAMERYASGDGSAFAALYDALAPDLHRHALRLGAPPALAQELVQETLLRLHCARDQYIRGAPVRPWAVVITRRLVIDAHRRLRQPPAELPEELAAGESPADEALDTRRAEAWLREELRRLPEGLRAPFEMVKLRGLAVAEAAAALGLTPATVKIRTFRALLALKLAWVRRHGSR